MSVISRIRDLGERLLSVGASGYAAETRRRLLVVNFMAYLIVLASINYILIYAVFDFQAYAPVIYINCIHVLCGLAVPLLHRINDHFGAYFIAFFEFIGLFALTAYLGPESGIQLNYIIGAAATFLAIDRQRIVPIVIILVSAFALHLAARFVAPQTGLMIEADPVVLANVYLMSALTCFGLISAIVYYALLTKDRAEARTTELLHNILPVSIADRLKEKPAATIAEYYPAATVMFTDTVGYTSMASDIGAERTVAMLNDVFSAFDELAERFGVEKIKTVGDAYMVVSGAPESAPDHMVRIASMALRLRDVVAAIGEIHKVPLQIRIGIAAGPLIGGVIGKQKLVFDVWGETVNMAARLETHGVPGRIHISKDVAAALESGYRIAPRELIDIKGVGLVSTFFLAGEKNS